MRTDLIRRKKNGKPHLTNTVHAALDEVAGNYFLAYQLLAPLVTNGLLTYSIQRYGQWVAREIGAEIRYAGYRATGPDATRTMHEKCLAHCWQRSQDWTPKDEQKDENPPEDEQEDEQDEDEQKDENPQHEFLAWVERVQEYQLEQDVDPWGMRQAINGGRLIKAGMPQEAIKDAFTIDFDDEARHSLGVRPFDLTAWGSRIAEDGESANEAIVRVTMRAGVNACAVGGKGIGKTTTFEKIAEKDDATIAVISCSDDGIRPDLFGTLTPGIREGYVLAEVAEAMLKAENGEKVFVLLDEADALTPSDALKLNRALEQRKINHPFLGRTIKFGRNVQFFAAMNTTGNGADEDFTGRDKQDAAFLDRFFRFRVNLDRELQRELFLAELS